MTPMPLYKELPNAYPDGYARRVGLPPSKLYMAERCAVTPNGNFLVRDTHGHWTSYSSASAAGLAMQGNWAGGTNGLTADDIKAFMRHDCPVVTGAMMVPTSTAPAIQFMGRMYVNSWVDTVTRPDYAALSDPTVRGPLTLLLRMIREGLCGKSDERSLEDMIMLANSRDEAELEFRFVLSWLAAPLQQVGRLLQTNLWLVGDKGGSGKGTLNTIMSMIYGAGLCALLNGAEVEQGGWTDAIAGKLWVSLNEINPQTGKFDWGSFIKQVSTEEWVMIRRRNTDSYPVLAFAQYYITMNKENPPCLDSYDRRNFLVATTTDPKKLAIAPQVQELLHGDTGDVQRLLGAFVALLHRHKVQDDLLAIAPATQIKRDVQQASAKDGEGTYWLENDDNYPRDQWCHAKTYLDSYEAYNGRKSHYSPRTFGGVMSALGRKGLLEVSKPAGKTHAGDYRVSSEKYPRRQSHSTGTAKQQNVVSLPLPPRSA